MKKFLLTAALLSSMTTAALAGPISWVDWTSATTGANGSAQGSAAGISVSYTGDVAFAQLGTGINYWTEGNPAPYTGNAVIDNAPTAAEMIAMQRAGTTQTITFSQAVLNPVMAIVSMGQPGVPVTYDFNTPFVVLSEGLGYWGDGTYTLGAGDTLIGRELHAAIQFVGTFTSISWSTPQAEYWHGFTFGLPSQDVSEPGALALFGLALLGLFGRMKRREQSV